MTIPVSGGIVIVRGPLADGFKTQTFVKPPGGGVGLAHLQKMGAGPAGKLGPEQFGGDVQAPEIGMNGDVQNLAFLIAHGTGNQESGDAGRPRAPPGNRKPDSPGLAIATIRGRSAGSRRFQADRAPRPGEFARAAGIRFPKQRALARADLAPAEVPLHVDAAGLGDAAAKGVVFEQSLDGSREILRLVCDPDVDASAPGPSPAQPEDVETTARSIAIASRTLRLVPAETERGNDGEIRFDIERPDVGDEFEQADAIVLRDGREPGVLAPVEQRIRAGDYCERDLRQNVSRRIGQTCSTKNR